MPSQPGVLSFHNRWYPLAVTTASPMTFPSRHSIKLITAPVFVATKLEAFKGRGNRDFLASHDLEDVVTVVGGRPAYRNDTHKKKPNMRPENCQRTQNRLYGKRKTLARRPNNRARAFTGLGRRRHSNGGHGIHNSGLEPSIPAL